MTDKENLSPKMREILDLIKKGQIDEALKLAGEKEIPEILRIAGDLWSKREHDVVLRMMERIIELEPNHATAWFNLSGILSEMGRDSEALSAFDNSIELDPGNTEAMIGKGVTLIRLGKPQAALQLLDDVLDREPDNVHALGNKGALLADLDRYEDALEALERASALDPKNATAFYNKGITHNRLGQSKEALESLNRALEIDAGLTAAWFNKGTTLTELGRYEDALAAHDMVIGLDPKNPKPWHNKGVAFERLNRDQEALDSYNKALEIDPGFAPPGINRAVLLSRLGRYKEALDAHDAVLKLHPQNANARFNKGVELLNMFRYEEAERNFIKAGELFSFLSEEPNAEMAIDAAKTAKNGLALMKRLRSLDVDFMSSLRSQTLLELKSNVQRDGQFIAALTEDFAGKSIPMDSLRILESKRACIESLSDALSFGEVGLDTLHTARTVFRELNLTEFLAAVNAIDTIVEALQKYRSLEDVPHTEEIALLYGLNAAQMLDGTLSTEISKAFQLPPLTADSEGAEERVEIKLVKLIDGNPACEWVKVCLVQLDFSLTPTFPFILKDACKEDVKRKILGALDIAVDEGVDIICFPELSFAEEWVNEIKTNYSSMMVVCGSYYDDDNRNICPTIIDGDDYRYAKCHQANFEEKFAKEMACGKFIPQFETRLGRIIVPLCVDYSRELAEIYRRKPDFILNPRCDIDKNHSFQKLANGQIDCDEGSRCYTYTILVNALNVVRPSRRGGGGTALVAFEHIDRIDSYAIEGLRRDDPALARDNRKDDPYKYKLFEARGEMMVIAAVRVGPSTERRTEPGNWYRFENNQWTKLEDPRVWPGYYE
ncbi:MAG: tetratricopeptide repeat protein [Candidatus Coatesbacteria bacterium]|nr:tetratricopeptide repeat protein [Candidatus Coatesbacteria bacterium]